MALYSFTSSLQGLVPSGFKAKALICFMHSHICFSKGMACDLAWPDLSKGMAWPELGLAKGMA